MALDPLNTEDDVSPEDFLRRVREMTLERDREDRQRAADLEKDILQSREQRRARRAGEHTSTPVQSRLVVQLDSRLLMQEN